MINKKLGEAIAAKMIDSKKSYLKVIAIATGIIVIIVATILILLFAEDTVENGDIILEYQTYSAPYLAQSPELFTEVMQNTYENSKYIPGTKDDVTSAPTNVKRYKGANYDAFYNDAIPKAFEIYYETGGRVLPSVFLGQWIAEAGWVKSSEYKNDKGVSRAYNVCNMTNYVTDNDQFGPYSSWQEAKEKYIALLRTYYMFTHESDFSNDSAKSLLEVKNINGHKCDVFTRTTSNGHGEVYQTWCVPGDKYTGKILEYIDSNGFQWFDEQAKEGVKGEAALKAFMEAGE